MSIPTQGGDATPSPPALAGNDAPGPALPGFPVEGRRCVDGRARRAQRVTR
jgi:hypothetical protein